MKGLILLVVLACAVATFAAPRKIKKAERCSTDKCVLPDCRCSTKKIPGDLSPADTPQFVFLTFDDAVTETNYHEYFEKAFFDRKNPDGCPISTTHFVSHEYTDYAYVNHLHGRGHEIALHSITHTSIQDYWKNLKKDQHILEFGGERELISHFANIPIEDLKGGRMPLLQLSGDESFKAFKEIGLTYDCSWPTRGNFWPYTLDYASLQDCPLPPCPQESVPGLWVVPMIMMKDDNNNVCSMVDACTEIPDDAEGIFNFMKKNFDERYPKKVPLGLYMHAAWFGQRDNAFEGYLKFLDYIGEMEDVYVVSVSRGLEWVRHPTKLSELKNLWPECQKTHEPSCKTNEPMCALEKDDEQRFMRVCSVDCPDIYPWLGNPLGEL